MAAAGTAALGKDIENSPEGTAAGTLSTPRPNPEQGDDVLLSARLSMGLRSPLPGRADGGEDPLNDKDSPTSPGSTARLRELTGLMNSAIARLGPGPYQLVVLILGGGVYAAEGALLLMLSLLARGLAAEWELSPLVAFSFMTMLFSGLILGTILGGVACDRFGRRIPILLTYFGISTFLLCAIVAPSFSTFLASKLFLGFFLGFGVPAANAIVAESSPPVHRSNIYCMTMILFSCGQLYAAGIVWAASPSLRHEELNWRRMLGLSALMPGVLFVLAYFFLLESPHWLLVTWQVSEARAVLKAMVRYKRMDEPEEVNSWAAEEIAEQMRSPPPRRHRAMFWGLSMGGDGDEKAKPNEETPLLGTAGRSKAVLAQVAKDTREAFEAGYEFARVRLEALFSPSFRRTTCIMLYVTFAVNYAYYGMIYGLPDTLKRSSTEGEDRWSPAAGVFFSAMFEIPGVFVAIVLGMTIGRRKNMSFAFFGCGTSLCFTMHALYMEEINGTAGLASIFCAKLLLATGYIVVYLYLLECYPTTFRATGLAFCIVLGRGGAFCCPFLYDGLAMMHFGPAWFFASIAGTMLLASTACCLLPYETKDAELEGEAPPGTASQLRC